MSPKNRGVPMGRGIWGGAHAGRKRPAYNRGVPMGRGIWGAHMQAVNGLPTFILSLRDKSEMAFGFIAPEGRFEFRQAVYGLHVDA